uniref:Uncharacterized protein n=1 Tax=Anguilla anguilla TaxID=7936 RepID=A0A0E9RDV3_ANGAN
MPCGLENSAPIETIGGNYEVAACQRMCGFTLQGIKRGNLIGYDSIHLKHTHLHCML